MTRYILTGASGHIGNNLVRLINQIEPESEILALTRREIEKELTGTDCTQVIGDLFDESYLSNIIQKGDIVVHLAGLIDLTDKRADEMYRVNYELTKKLCKICKEAQVRRFIYVGSVDGIAKDGFEAPITEPSSYDPSRVEGHYGKSKAMAMQYVLNEIQAKTSFSVAMAIPSAVIGAHDYKPSAVGKVILNTLNGRAELGIHGGYDFVSVTDVCKAIYVLCHNDICDQFILCGGAMRVEELYDVINREMGLRKKPILLPKWVILPFLPFVKVLNKTTLKALCEPHQYSSEKAKRELAYAPLSAREAVSEAVQWFKKEKEHKRKT